MSLPSIFGYLPEYASSICKMAEEKKPDSEFVHKAKTVGKGFLGFGAGTLAGAGLSALADKIHHSRTGQHIPSGMLMKSMPLVSGAAGLAYSLYKHKEREELSRGNQPDVAQGRLPTK